jgi:signal transduction histidine kinase
MFRAFGALASARNARARLPRPDPPHLAKGRGDHQAASAFSRKQVLELRPPDLHEALTDSEFMLPRLLGSDVQLSFRHEAAKSWILADPAQIEQVVANLAINARDAMPEGGCLSISTRNATQVPENGVGQAPKPPTGWCST